MEAEILGKPSLLLHRRISISGAPYAAHSQPPPHRPPPLDLELISLHKPSPFLQSYTSLKDILPSSATINSPSAATMALDISIRNRLVKQAAAAYLQPTTPTPSTNPSLLCRLCSAVLRLIATTFNTLLRLFPSPRNFFNF